MDRIITAVPAGFLAFCLLSVGDAFAQQPSRNGVVAQRTQALVASFNKSKHAVKERHGVRVEKYKEIRSEPVIKANVRDYGGSYKVPDLGLSLELRVDEMGNVVGTGYDLLDADASVWRKFTLTNAHIEGALLTGGKVYERGGTVEPFEGVFINKTSFDGPADRGVTTFGLGVIGRAVSVAGITVDKFFYERKPNRQSGVAPSLRR